MATATETKATNPTEAAKGMGQAMKLHVLHGIAGASRRQLDSLERRGIIEESERRPGYLELSALGLCVRTLLRGYNPESMGDDQRLAYFDHHGEFAAEWEECDRHPGHGQIYEWAFDVPDNGDRLLAIECSEPSIIRGCPLCNAEYEARYQDDCA